MNLFAVTILPATLSRPRAVVLGDPFEDRRKVTIVRCCEIACGKTVRVTVFLQFGQPLGVKLRLANLAPVAVVRKEFKARHQPTVGHNHQCIESRETFPFNRLAADEALGHLEMQWGVGYSVTLTVLGKQPVKQGVQLFIVPR